MNNWISPTTMLRWAGLGLLGCLLATWAYSMREQDACCLSMSAAEFYRTVLRFGIWVGGIAFAIVGAGLLTTKAPSSMRQAQEKELDHQP